MMSIYKSFGFSNSPYHPITDYTWFVDPLSFTKSVLFCCFPLHAQMQIDLLFLFSCTDSTLFLLMYKCHKCSSICHSLPKYKCGVVWFVHVQMWLDLSFLSNYKCGTVHSSLIYKYRKIVDPC